MRLPLLAVVVLFLAGCATPPAEDVAVTGANETAVGPASLPPPEERVDDGSRTDLGHMPHMHDYWKGKERVTLYDGEVEPSELDAFDVAKTIAVEKQAKFGAQPWVLPDGAILFEGAGALEVTASWSDASTTSLVMNFKTPEMQRYEGRLPLRSGEVGVIELTPGMTDMPHSKTSRWRFEFEPAESPGVMMGTFALKVDIVKMSDISLFPAHPELFEGKTEKAIHDADQSFSEVSYAKRVPALLTTGEFPEKEVTPAMLVPMETVWMRVEVDILKTNAAPGNVADIRFFYHGADKTVLGHPYTLPIEGSLAEKRLVYAFPVTMDQTDTPYGKESQWRFFVEPTTKFTDQASEPDCGGCTDVEISYHLRIIAFDHETGEPTSKKEGDE